MVDYYWTHALISDETIDAIHKYCNFSPDASNQTKQCEQALDVVDRLFDILDIYNIYAPLCFSSGVAPSPKEYSVRLLFFVVTYYADALIEHQAF